MWNKLTNSKVFYMILAIMCSIGLWLYIDIIEAPQSTTTVYNIPVTFIGEDRLEEDGLMIISGKNTTVNLQLEGSRTAVSQVNRNNITITVQAYAQINSEGHYSLLYDVDFPSSVASQLRIVSRSIDAIDVDVVQMTSKTVEIQGKFVGTAAEGARISDTDFEFEQNEVTVSGERSLVEQVDHALVTLDVDDLSSTWSGELPIVLVDADGNEVDMTNLTCDITEVYTIFPVQTVKEVPLTVSFTSGAGATSENATATIDPETVTISGTPERLDQIESINLGSIDLSQIVTSEVVNMTIPVPEGVSIISGITSAKVTVSMSGLDTRIVQTSDIELINTPEWISNVELVTQALEVRIRGASDTMKLVQDQDVYVIVDLSTLDEGAEGTRTLVATVGVRGFADVGAVGEYQVVVNITAS